MILLKFTGETFKPNPEGSDASGSDMTVKRPNQVAIEVVPYLRRRSKTRRDSDHDLLKSLGRAGAVVKFPLDMPERPWPHSSGEFMNARIDGLIVIIARPNPEWRNAVRVRGQRLLLCVSAHRFSLADSPTRLMVG